MYTRAGELPTATEHDCSSQRPGNTELCWAFAPQAGDYFIGVYAATDLDGLRIVGHLR